MSKFASIFREERYFCTHLFRVLCEGLGTRQGPVGLRRFLAEAGLEPVSPTEIEEAWIFTEAAVFRDVFFHAADKDAFLENLYDRFVPLVGPRYGGKISKPMRP